MSSQRCVSFVRVILPCDPTVDDTLFHICMLSISVSKPCVINWDCCGLFKVQTFTTASLPPPPGCDGADPGCPHQEKQPVPGIYQRLLQRLQVSPAPGTRRLRALPAVSLFLFDVTAPSTSWTRPRTKVWSWLFLDWCSANWPYWPSLRTPCPSAETPRQILKVQSYTGWKRREGGRSSSAVFQST